jgi:hypothetical protein
MRPAGQDRVGGAHFGATRNGAPIGRGTYDVPDGYRHRGAAGREPGLMSVMKTLRRVPALAGPATAVLAATGLAMSGLMAVAPAQAAPATLTPFKTFDLGRLGSSFTYQFTEDPSGNAYYFRGSAVYEVKANRGARTILRVRGNVLAVAASTSNVFVDVGRTVTEYRQSNHHKVRSWTLPRSPSAPTSAGLYLVGSTVWAWTDWATDESGFQYASVSRFSTSRPAVHEVSKNNVYPADMAADSTGLYFETVRTNGGNGFLAHVTPSGISRNRLDMNLDAPLALYGGHVYLLAIHEHQGGKTYLDSFAESNLAPFHSAVEWSKFTDIAGNGEGLFILGGGKMALVLTASDYGQLGSQAGVSHAVGLLPGPAAGVITVVKGKTYLTWDGLTG